MSRRLIITIIKIPPTGKPRGEVGTDLTSREQRILIASRHVLFIIGAKRRVSMICSVSFGNHCAKRTYKVLYHLLLLFHRWCFSFMHFIDSAFENRVLTGAVINTDYIEPRCRLVERGLTYKLLTCSSPFSLDGKNNQQEILKRILTSDPPSKPIHLNPRRRLSGGLSNAKELKHQPFFMDAAPDFTWETSNFLDEFTKGPVTHMSPPIIDNNKIDWHFSNYLYVATSILYINNKVSRGIFSDKQQPSQSDLYSMRFEESTFFQNTRQEYAVKIISKKIESSREKNLLRLIEVYHDRLHTYIVRELLTAKEIMRQLLSAMRYVHESGIVHHDLKPENIVFAKRRNNCELLPMPYCTFPYAIPEIIAKQGCDESCNMCKSTSLGESHHPSVFDFSEEAIKEYLISSFSEKIILTFRRSLLQKRVMKYINRNLEVCSRTNKHGDASSDISESLLQIAQDEISVHRRHKAIKRLKRSPTIIVE
ncbi:hypothetical protein ACFW04_013710 [Cataglyphis niger]